MTNDFQKDRYQYTAVKSTFGKNYFEVTVEYDDVLKEYTYREIYPIAVVFDENGHVSDFVIEDDLSNLLKPEVAQALCNTAVSKIKDSKENSKCAS